MNIKNQTMKKIILSFIILVTLTLSNNMLAQNAEGPFKLQPLGYDYKALEPFFDAQTMEIHHSKHLAAYVNNLNAAVKNTPAADMTLEEIMANTAKFDMKVRNNAGGVYNHDLFFSTLKVNNGEVPSGDLATAINSAFGSFDNMKTQMNAAGMGRFGSGWAWLYVTPEKKLAICSTPNQDNPMMDIAENKGIPILGIDVWEHAYYLKYQNKRGDFLNAFWNVVNWQEVARRYAEALKVSGK
jgi:Fe-Mn family superoxide dismutase